MVNRNAARHLALVVSILICFFVYMGYRLRGQPEASAGGDGQSASLMTVNDNHPAAPTTTVRSPIVTPSGLPPPLGGGEAAPELGSLRPPSRDAERAPSGAPVGLPPPPSGSIEESGRASSAPGGAITGLIPAPPLSPPASSASPQSSNSPISEEEDENFAGLVPPPPGGDFKPPAPSGEMRPPPATAVPAESGPGAARGAASPVGGTLLPPPPSSSPITPPSPPERTGAVAPQGAGLPIPPAAPPERHAGPPPTVVSPPPSSQRPAPPPVPQSNGSRPGPAASDSVRVYVIQPGDNLSRIAARELGDIALADNIFLMNRDVIYDPDHLQVGEKIRLPVKESLAAQSQGAPRPAGNGAAAVPPPSPRPGVGTTVPAPAAGKPARVHRVARGDTLSSIALRYYGSSAGWRFLYESNTNVIPNPNQLTVGTELVVPPYGDK